MYLQEQIGKKILCVRLFSVHSLLTRKQNFFNHVHSTCRFCAKFHLGDDLINKEVRLLRKVEEQN